MASRIHHLAPNTTLGENPLACPAERLSSGDSQPDGIEAALLRIWRDLLRLQDISIHDNFFELGGDSILAAQLMFEIDKKFQKRFELSRLFSHPTIEALAQQLRTATTPRAIHIVPMRPQGTGTPLFFVHCGTGHVLRYRALTSLLDSACPVYGLRAPDVRSLEKPPTVEDLAELYVADIRQIQPHGPYQICGFSFGGLVAFEIARRLKTMNEPVSFLALLDTPNHAYYRKLPFLKSLQFRSIYLGSRLSRYARDFFLGKWGKVYAILHDRIVWHWKELLWKRRDDKHSPSGDEGPEDILDTVIMFANIGLVFEPRPYPGRINLFHAIHRDPEFSISPTLGWSEIAQNGVDVCDVPGDHMEIMEYPAVSTLARELGKRLVDHPGR